MKRHTIQRKLVTRYIALGILPVFLLALSIFYFMNHLMRNKVIEAKMGYLEQASMNMDTRFSYIDSSLSSFFSNISLQSSIQILGRTPYGFQHTEAAGRLSAHLQSMMMDEPCILSICIYSTDQKLLISKNNGAIPYSEVLTAHPEWLDLALEGNGHAISHGTQLYRRRAYEKWGFCTTILMRDTSAEGSMDPIGYLQILFDERFFSDVFEKMRTDSTGYFILTDASGNVLSSANKDYLSLNITEQSYYPQLAGHISGQFREEVDGKDSLVLFFRSRETGNLLIEISPYAYLTQEFSYFGTVFIFLTAICALALIIACFAAAASITRPIQSIRNSMQLFSEGNLSHESRLTDRVPLELWEINQSFNDMTAKIQHLFDTTILQEKRTREIEIRMLQYQINPHFLYNTISSIGLTAMMGDTTAVAQMTQALGRLIKNVVGKTGHMIPLEQELKNLSDFITIMNIRFDNAIQLKTRVDENLLSCLIPNMLLQPLAENSIFHGMHKDEISFLIEVTAEASGQDLILQVIDHGCGMDQAEAERILAGDSCDSRPAGALTQIGIHNLHERILLSFGPAYGLKIHSSHEAGTTVQIKLPLIAEQGESNGL